MIIIIFNTMVSDVVREENSNSWPDRGHIGRTSTDKALATSDHVMTGRTECVRWLHQSEGTIIIISSIDVIIDSSRWYRNWGTRLFLLCIRIRLMTR